MDTTVRFQANEEYFSDWYRVDSKAGKAVVLIFTDGENPEMAALAESVAQLLRAEGAK